MKKIGILAMVLVLCLSAVGIGVAKWTDSVRVEKVISSGEIEVGIADIGVTDQGLDHIAYWLRQELLDAGMTNAQINAERKDVATHTSVPTAGGNPWVGEKTLDPPGGMFGQDTYAFYESCTETISNIYPGYMSGTYLLIGAFGTVPVKIESIDITALNDPDNLLDYINITGYCIDVIRSDGSIEPGGCAAGDLWDLEEDLAGIQLHPCDTIFVYVEFETYEYAIGSGDMGPTMPQGANAELQITVSASQWNEAGLDI